MLRQSFAKRLDRLGSVLRLVILIDRVRRNLDVERVLGAGITDVQRRRFRSRERDNDIRLYGGRELTDQREERQDDDTP